MNKVSGCDALYLNAYGIGLSFMWNSLHVPILPAVLLNYLPESQKNTWLGLLTFFGVILAMLIQPLSGAISDRWQSRLGRRRPLIWAGTGGDLVFLLILGLVGGLSRPFRSVIWLQVSTPTWRRPGPGLVGRPGASAL